MQALRKNWLPLAVTIVIVAIIAVFLLSRMGSTSKLPVDGAATPFTLQNTLGEDISLDNTAGKARLIYFYFAHCPDVCLPTNHLLAKVQDGLKEKGIFGEKTQIMSITFDPERDTTEFLTEYMSNIGADPSGWHFLRTDDVDAVRALTAEYTGMDVFPDGDSFIHGNVYTLVDGDGNVRKTYSPNTVVVFDQDKTDEFISEIVEDMASLAR